MNKYTNVNMFSLKPKTILLRGEKSGILIKECCVVIDDVVYERVAKGKYRFFFSDDDYDYLTDQEFIKMLDEIFNK